MSSLKVGKAIYNILANDTLLSGKVKKRIFPLVADSDTTFPFIVYKRNSIFPVGSKDRYSHEESATVEIAIAATTYNESIEIAELVTNSLVKSKGNYVGIEIKRIELIDANEEYTDDTYIQQLNYKITIISE